MGLAQGGGGIIIRLIFSNQSEAKARDDKGIGSYAGYMRGSEGEGMWLRSQFF